MMWMLKRTVLLRRFFVGTENICLKRWVRKYLQFYAQKFCSSKPMLFFFIESMQKLGFTESFGDWGYPKHTFYLPLKNRHLFE